MLVLDLSGIWQCRIPGQEGTICLPGTLDEAGIGFADDPEQQWKVDEVRRIGFYHSGDPIVTRLTRHHSYEGPAELTRTVSFEVPDGMRLFVEVERARHLRLRINGQEAPAIGPACLSAPQVFEITGLATGRDELMFISDNHYPDWPRDAIVYSSAASDETQTNWNGLLGKLHLRAETPVYLSYVHVLPQGRTLSVRIGVDAACPYNGTLSLTSGALAHPVTRRIAFRPGTHEIRLDGLPLKNRLLRWDLDEGNLYSLTASLSGMSGRTVSFGIRDFGQRHGRLTLNGRRIFLRGETNCAVFPETGCCPMTVEEWTSILRQYKAYGTNCVRFHSHCPPEAAFTAADALGLLMQPELSHWDPEHAFSSPEAKTYYRNELLQILSGLSCHPSFVMLTFGNELHTDAEGHAFMNELLRLARKTDPTRLYANGSNVHYGALGVDPASDFYTAMSCQGMEMRATCDGPTGWLNHEYPNACHQYDATMQKIREQSEQPVFSFEVGQYEILPDFSEIQQYNGVTVPNNLSHIEKKVRAAGLGPQWAKMIEASGESSLQCYRAEVESALRTAEYSGISLLSLQDFPGQGTALIGMMNAHLQPKPFPFAQSDRFAAFFSDTLPLILLPRYTYTEGEMLTARVQLAHYGKAPLSGIPEWSLTGPVSCQGQLPPVKARPGSLTDLGTISLPLGKVREPVQLTLGISFCGHVNTYPIWVYPDHVPECPPDIYECRRFDQQARDVLEAGGRVYLSPESTGEALPNSLRAQFSPDFWSVCTFPQQSGCMGLLIDDTHPLFAHFPTRSYGTWQWWPMANARALLLPERISCIVAEMDSYAFLRPMAMLFECRCGSGRLLVSSMGLQDLSRYPEARALTQAIYTYMQSDSFSPTQSLSMEWIQSLFERKEVQP